MQILDRAKSGGEIVAFNESEANVQEEVLRRSHKAGYCTKNGEPTQSTRIMTTMPCGEERLNVWPRDKNGNLIDD